MSLGDQVKPAGAVFPASKQRPAETSADDEAFVVELATSLIVLVARWRERAGYIRCDATGTTTAGEVVKCADELEAVLRSAT